MPQLLYINFMLSNTYNYIRFQQKSIISKLIKNKKMQIKSIYQLFLTALLILFISINESYSQTSYGDNAGKQGGDLNSFFGIWSGSNNTATHNSFFGNEAGRYNVDGNKNSFFGSTAGLENTSGNHNSYVGYAAGKLNTTGSKNSFFGAYSGYYNEDGANNSYVGYESGTNNKSGENFFFWKQYR